MGGTHSADPAADERDALNAARNLQRSGNFVAAYDAAQDALCRWPDSHDLQHASILALASCGSTQAALTAFGATSLAATGNEDFLALEARLFKDLAFQGGATAPLLAQAAHAYERIAERTGGTYSAQNAALLWALAGDDARATRLASTAFETLTRQAVPTDEEAAYFHWSVIAEAALVLRDRSSLASAIAHAQPLCRHNLWARTRTYGQMRRLERLRPELADLIAQWYRPAIGFVIEDPAHLAAIAQSPGYSIERNTQPSRTDTGAGAIEAATDARADTNDAATDTRTDTIEAAATIRAAADADARAAGAIPGDADAELPALAYCTGSPLADAWHCLKERGVQLHFILPRSPAAHPAAANGTVVSTSGAGVVAVVHGQASGQQAGHTWSSLLLDEEEDQRRVCTETALGLSLAHADALESPWVVLYRAQGRWQVHRPLDRAALSAQLATPQKATTGPGARRRRSRRDDRARYALLFADAVGYSLLNAADTRRYWTTLLPNAAAAVLHRYTDHLVLRKTWGDAIHGIFRTATSAARAALELTAATAQLADDLELGRRLKFRVAVHFGSATYGVDPIEEAPTFFGPQLSFSARIVPVAPPGSVFVTEPFAAQLSLEGASGMACSHVGTTSLAKDYARVRLLSLAYRQ